MEGVGLNKLRHHVQAFTPEARETGERVEIVD